MNLSVSPAPAAFKFNTAHVRFRYTRFLKPFWMLLIIRRRILKGLRKSQELRFPIELTDTADTPRRTIRFITHRQRHPRMPREIGDRELIACFHRSDDDIILPYPGIDLLH